MTSNSEQNQYKKILQDRTKFAHLPPKDRQFTFDHTQLDEILKSPYLTYYKIEGKNLFTRTHQFQTWMSNMAKNELYLYNKQNVSSPTNYCKGIDVFGNQFEGPNFASADYMGMQRNQAGVDAAIKTAKEYGIGSGGSPMAFGEHKYYGLLKERMKKYWQCEGIAIFSTGWLGTYGAIRAMIRQDDHIVMDQLSHNCILEGSRLSTRNIHIAKHLDLGSYEKKIQDIRQKHPEAAILVITEGLFSMDSDCIDLVSLQKMTKKYESFLMIDCAHDFGCMGENGRGTWEKFDLQDRSNVILTATGSKSLATNVGFVGCTDASVIMYLQGFSPAYIFVNSISPIQAATALAHLDVMDSIEGKEKRRKIIANASYLKEEFKKKGYATIGMPSPIVPLWIGNELVMQVCMRLMLDEGVTVNAVEFPAVSIGHSRFRICVTPLHTKENMDQLVDSFDRCVQKAFNIVILSCPQEISSQVQNPKNYVPLNASKL